MELLRSQAARRGLAMILMAVLEATSAEAGKRYALLIAINKNHVAEGQLKDLEYAISDATKLSELLVAQGFEEPIILQDANAQRGDILRELNWHARLLKEDDEFVLFYSGHGVRNTVVNKQSYWMTYGAAMSGLDASSIRLTHLMDYVREMKPLKKLVLLDHCFSGDVIERGLTQTATAAPPAPGGARDVPLSPLLLEKTAQIVRGELDGQVKAEGIVVLAAARHFAYESADLKQGVFTRALINALESPVADVNPKDGKLSLPELVTYVSNWVGAYAGSGKQVPVTWLSGANLEEWIFAPNLPTDAAGVRDRVRRYEGILGSWNSRGHISYETMSQCLSLLSRWKRAEEAKAKLPEADATLLAKLLQALDSSNLPEDGRGRALELAFNPGGQ